MPNLNLISRYKFATDLIMSPSTLVSEFLHGIPLTDQNGRNYPTEEIKNKILKAQKQIENYLEIKLVEQEVNEILDYNLVEWLNWGHLKLRYKCNSLVEVKGYLSNYEVVDFNTEMFVVNGRNVALVPGRALQSNLWVGRSGTFPVLRSGVSNVPNFWHIKHISGFNQIPLDILQAVGKLAVMQIMAILGDILLGAGIASESLSFDGFSQSIGTTQSAMYSAYSARINQYKDELKNELPHLKQYYRGIVFETV